MNYDLMFFANNILLGTGLAMDAFSVSLANGLSEPKMKKGKICAIAGVFAFFQALMPMTGWFLVSSLAEKFVSFQKFIPWIALLLLLYIGINMIAEGRKKDNDSENAGNIDAAALLLQGLATSIDALSVGFTISDYNMQSALLASFIIAAVTFAICVAGVIIGKRFGTKMAGKSSLIGGIILIFIGLEIFVKGVM